MVWLRKVTLGLVGVVGLATSVEACRVERIPPTLEQTENAEYPNLGFVGRIVATYQDDETKKYGKAIVEVRVTRDFSKQLPSVIFVLNPGCCCVGISRKVGDEVRTIVRRIDSGLYFPSY